MTSHYVVSDVHGHFEELVTELTTVGLLDADGDWAGGRDELWVLGDVFDRGPDAISILDLIRRLSDEANAAGGRAELLLGNHEMLALGMRWFGAAPVPSSEKGNFAGSFGYCEGQAGDQERLTDDMVGWLVERPVIARVGDWLAMHTDNVAYLDHGESIEEINTTLRAILAERDHDQMWNLWVSMTRGRFAFLGEDGPDAARSLLDSLGGNRLVHGHTTIPDLLDRLGTELEPGPLVCADGLALAVDGGLYDGGQLLVVRLEDHETALV